MTKAQRVVLMLQGPMTPFFAHLRDRLVDGGARVIKVQICPADLVFWRRPGAVRFRADWADFEPWLKQLISAEGVTDLALWGDERELHRRAIDLALAARIRVHALELGYLRPNWLTVETDGLASSSHMPRDPAMIRAMAEGLPAPATDRLAKGSFAMEAVYDLIFNLSNVFLSPFLFPRYRRHAIRHPFAEYAGWTAKALRRPWTDARRARILQAFATSGRRTIIVPLQLSTDFQLRSHSPFPDLGAATNWILASFAAHAPDDLQLLFKIHPLDNGLDRFDLAIPRRAADLGIADRVGVVDGGDLGAMLKGAAGVVTVNSTVGLTALEAGLPVIVLGNAIFDVAGLTHQGPLDGFWAAPEAPDADLLAAFLALLADRTQVRGGVVSASEIAVGAPAVAARMMEEAQRLPSGAPGPRPRPVFRRAREWRQQRAGR